MENAYMSDYPPAIRRESKEDRFDPSITTMRNEQTSDSATTALALNRLRVVRMVNLALTVKFTYLKFQTSRLNFFNHCTDAAGPKRISKELLVFKASPLFSAREKEMR